MLGAASSTVIDSILFRDAFGTAAMREVFSDRALIDRYVEVEVALVGDDAVQSAGGHTLGECRAVGPQRRH